MTFWATLWYAGSVVATLGYNGMTEGECDNLKTMMETNIEYAYSVYDMRAELAEEGFGENKWLVTCENEKIPVDEKYKDK